MIKFCFKERIIFFAKLLVNNFRLSIIRTSQVQSSLFQYLTGTIPFSKHPFENIDTMLATWPFNRPYPRTRLFRNSFTLQRCTQSTRSRTSAGNHPRTVHNSMRTSDNWSGLFTMVKLVYDYPFSWVCAPRQRVAHSHGRSPTVATRGKLIPHLVCPLFHNFATFGSEDPIPYSILRENTH